MFKKIKNKVKRFIEEHPNVIFGIAAFFALWYKIRFLLW